MSGYRSAAQPVARKSLEDRAPALLRLAGEVPGSANVRVKRVRSYDITVVHVDLVLRSSDGEFHRTICLAESPGAVRDVLEQNRQRGPLARDATPGDLPKGVRVRLDEIVEEQTALGYAVEVARMTVTEEEIVWLRYQRDRRPWVDLWLDTSTPAALAYGDVYGREWGAGPFAGHRTGASGGTGCFAMVSAFLIAGLIAIVVAALT